MAEIVYDPITGDAIMAQPPRADGPESRAVTERQTVEPGSRRAQEIERNDAQQSTLDNLSDGFQSTAIAGAFRYIKDEGLSLKGLRKEERDYDKLEQYEALTTGIPYEYHDEIMENDSQEAAVRARVRIQEDLERGQRIAMQDGGTLAVLAGSLIDADLPLIAFSGGAYGAAKAAGVGMRAARMAGLGARGRRGAMGVAQGVNAGLQAGLAVGAVDAATRETADWKDLVAVTFQSALLGAGVGGALGGDVRASMRAAQQDFMERVARDDPSLREDLNVDEMASNTDNLEIYTREAGPSTAGASQVGATPSLSATLNDPVGPISPGKAGYIDASNEWREQSGWQQRKETDDENWFARAAMSPWGSFTVNNFATLYKSKAATANFMAGSIFESASGLGRGRITAATQAENYTRRIQSHLARDVRDIGRQWAKENNETFGGSGYGTSGAGQKVFDREVFLELNRRALGRPSGKDVNVNKAADQYEMAGSESLAIGRGRDGETPVDGLQDVPDRRGYTPYVWNGRNITQLERDGILDRDALVEAVADGYVKAGMNLGKDAAKVARATIERAVSKDADLDTSVLGLLSGDGQDFLRSALRNNGSTDAEIESILGRLVGKQGERSREGFAKFRNEIDMEARIRTKDGSELLVADLFDTNMHDVWQRYGRRMAGTAALARKGITNRAKRTEFIGAIRAEQRALGEQPMDAEHLEAMFSHFNGGPIWGYTKGSGTNEGIGAELAVAKRMTNLALLERLGLTQVAETGATIAQNGLANWWTRGPAAQFNKELKARNKELLDDMAYFNGRIGEDHLQFAVWQDIDDVSRADRNTYLEKAQNLSANAQYVQGYTSLFNQVRSFQQTTAVLGVADKVMRTLKKSLDDNTPLSPQDMARFQSDLGLMPEDIAALTNLIEDGVVEFRTDGKHTYVDRLNMKQWDNETGEVFASSLTRNMNQLVQKSMAGEQDAWMHTSWGSMMMHLKTFPLQAMHKQFFRNMRHMDTQNITTLMYGMATAAVAISVRAAIDGKDLDAADVAKGAFNYSNMTGFVPMLADPLMTIVGLEDYRFNRYGPYSDLTPPMFGVANDMRRIPGALWHTAAGESDYYDKQALKAIPFAGTYGFSKLFE